MAIFTNSIELKVRLDKYLSLFTAMGLGQSGVYVESFRVIATGVQSKESSKRNRLVSLVRNFVVRLRTNS